MSLVKNKKPLVEKPKSSGVLIYIIIGISVALLACGLVMATLLFS